MKSDQGSDKVVKRYDIEVHMYLIIIHTIYICSLYNDYASILEYPLSSPLVDW